MANQQQPPEGSNWITPYLTVAEAEASLVFYQKAFGFEPGMTMPDQTGKVMHAEMSYQGKPVMMFGPEGAWGGTSKTPANSGTEIPVGFYVYTDDVDGLAEQAASAGCDQLSPPEDMFWGDRIVNLRDPDGFVWTFATRVGEFDPSKIPDM